MNTLSTAGRVLVWAAFLGCALAGYLAGLIWIGTQ